MSDLPPLPDGFVVESDYDPTKDILASGYDFTNGYRTKQDIEDLKARGYKPAEHSLHLEGDAIDLVPGKSGKSLADVRAYAQSILAKWGNKGRVIDEGDHIHLQLEGWGQAPGTPGTPYSGMPDLPEGFQVAQRGSISKADLQQPTHGDQPATDPGVQDVGGFNDELRFNPHGAEQFHDALYTAAKSGQIKSVAEAQAWATSYNQQNGTDYGVADTDLTRQAIANAVAGKGFSVDIPQMSQTAAARLKERVADTKDAGHTAGASAVLGAEDTITRGAADEVGALVDTTGDFLTGKPWDYTSNLNATRDYVSAIRDEHPNYYTGGQIAGAFIDPIMPNASSVAGMAKIGATEGGVYGFNESDGTLADRAMSGAAGTIAGTVLGPVVGKTIEGATALARKVFGKEVPPLPEGFVPEEPAGAPLEGEVVPEAPLTPEVATAPESAAMASEPVPSVTSRPRDYIVPAANVEQAAATKGEQIAHPVTAADVAMPSLGDVARAGNINLTKIETPNDIDALMKFTTDSFDGFKGERRGVQSWDATQKLAADLGMTPDDLLARRTGQAYNAEEALAARNLLAASATETRKLADAAVNGTAEDKSAFIKSFFLHAAITEKASGAAAEAGRALNVYAKIAKASLGDTQAMQAAIKRLQNGASVDDIAAMVNSLSGDPAALNRFARNAIKPAFKDKLMFLWINSLLSGPKTHIVNMSSNLVTMAMGAPEAMVATGIGKVRQLAKATPTRKVLSIPNIGDRLYAAEWFPRFFGTIKGAADGLAAAREGFAKEAGGKIDAPQPAIGGKVGDIISIPTRLLNAEDEFFKAAIKQGELGGMAVRKAKMEGLKGSEFRSRVDYLMQSPTDDMLQSAADAALYKTFQRPLGPAMQKVSSAIQATPVLKLFVPFIRTPTNLLKYAIERTPAAPLLKEVREEFVAGGAKRDIAIARMTLGTGIGAIMAALAHHGHITGNGPADPSAKKALEAQGWQPYSFKVGNEYISYRRLDPWATIIGTAADAVELQSAMTDKQSQDTGAIVIGAMTQNLASKTWLSGLSDLIDAITDPKANAKNVITRLGTSIATPSIVAQTEGMVDPTVRDTSDPTYLGQLRKKIEARIPGLSSDVIPRRDILGHEVKSEMGPIARLISPFDVRDANPDPVAKAIYDSGARFSLPGRSVGGGRLPDDAFDAYQQVAARRFYDAMKEQMADTEWSGMSKQERGKVIERVKTRSRKDAREELFGF